MGSLASQGDTPLDPHARRPDMALTLNVNSSGQAVTRLRSLSTSGCTDGWERVGAGGQAAAERRRRRQLQATRVPATAPLPSYTLNATHLGPVGEKGRRARELHGRVLATQQMVRPRLPRRLCGQARSGSENYGR